MQQFYRKSNKSLKKGRRRRRRRRRASSVVVIARALGGPRRGGNPESPRGPSAAPARWDSGSRRPHVQCCCSLQVLATQVLFLQPGPALPSLFWEGHPEPIGRCSLEPNTSRVRPKREKKGKGDFAERGLPASRGPSQSARGGKPGSQGGRCWRGAGGRGCPPLALLLCGATVPVLFL